VNPVGHLGLAPEIFWTFFPLTQVITIFFSVGVGFGAGGLAVNLGFGLGVGVGVGVGVTICTGSV
jgi:hypothetical protein